jgi:hypothetical protein
MNKLIILIAFISFNAYTEESNFCNDNESVVFNCQLENTKFISICKIDDTLSYNYGRFDKRELFLKENIENAFSKKNYARGEKNTFSFKNGLYTYNVIEFFSMSNSLDEYYGINVTKNGDVIFENECKNLPKLKIPED